MRAQPKIKGGCSRVTTLKVHQGREDAEDLRPVQRGKGSVSSVHPVKLEQRAHTLVARVVILGHGTPIEAESTQAEERDLREMHHGGLSIGHARRMVRPTTLRYHT